MRIYVAVTSPYPWNRGVTVVGKGILNPLTAGDLLKILRDLFPFDFLFKITYQFSSIEW